VQDYKLGFRMLVKYPGLTLAGGLALAIAIGIGAGWYDLMGDLRRPTLPLPEGDRIVEVEMRNPLASGDERRLLHDFLTWRQNVRSIVDLGAYRTLERNLAIGDARPERVTVAETTASAFRVARMPPLLGRPLLDADEQPGATPVVVLGYSVWQRQFGGRPDAIGQTVRLGRATTTVVGVMPEGFMIAQVALTVICIPPAMDWLKATGVSSGDQKPASAGGGGRFLEWDGSPNQVPTMDKRFIWFDTYARWRIVDPLRFFQRQGVRSRDAPR
jgi:hypothetical protein